MGNDLLPKGSGAHENGSTPLPAKYPRLQPILGLNFHYASIEWPTLSTIAAIMKIQIASDLHLEMHHDRVPPLADFRPVAARDVLVLAGDIGVYTHALRFIEDEARISPVIYVPGNHEYHTDWGRRATDWTGRVHHGLVHPFYAV